MLAPVAQKLITTMEGFPGFGEQWNKGKILWAS